MTNLDIKKNRKAKKYTNQEYVQRFLWDYFGKLFFQFSFRTAFRWRSLLLRLFGARIAEDFHIYPSSKIYYPWNLDVGKCCAIGENVLIYNLGKVKLGDFSTISHGAHICAGSHDYTKADLPLEKEPIIIHDQVWICADAFVSPGVTIESGSVIGARAVVTKDIKAWTVVAGNPATYVKKRELSN